ncbi:MAG: Inosine-5'-monophosphate dehydrogenase [Candidatus Tokpelaia sp. JSC188]|nr:MAG: Inosine-5'-monophosphate dehydrogenase [Candidatus Tokpelaia sp. JSC188]
MAKILENSASTLALTFDDVLIQPGYSSVLPNQVELKTRIARDIELNLPLLSAAMDTVTEARLAIAMAQAGGMGTIHRNMKPQEQAEEVRQVKKFESGMVINPVTIGPDATLAEAQELMRSYGISGIPVVEMYASSETPGLLVGILTNRDVRFASNPRQKIHELMTYKNLITVRENVQQDEAKRLLHQNRIEKLLVIDNADRCVGLITVKDIEKAQLNPNASKDEHGRLRVGAAISVGKDGLERAERLLAVNVDVLVIDTAHGHSQRVLETLKNVRRIAGDTAIIAGNVATADATKALIDCGADAIKVGIGPGSICTTRIVSGAGVPQLTAIMRAVEVADKVGIPVIADGGIKFSGDFAKSLAAGAAATMVGSLLACTEESPGEVYLYQGRPFKTYRGMGSVGAMARGSADRYFQEEVCDELKLVPEGIEGQVAYKGPAATVLHQLSGGLRAAMGYVGARNLSEFHEKAIFIRITNAALHESHTHNVTITRESPNYPGRG